MPLTASTDLPELFAQTYEKEREFPTTYNNNLQSLPAPTPKYLGEFNLDMTRLTQKNFANFSLERLKASHLALTFYLIGRLAPEDSPLKLPSGQPGFSRLDCAFLGINNVILFLPLGGVSAPQIQRENGEIIDISQSELSFTEFFPDDTLILKGGCRNVQEITLFYNKLFIAPEERQAAHLSEADSAHLREIILLVGDQTKRHMQPIQDRLKADEDKARTEKEAAEQRMRDYLGNDARELAILQGQALRSATVYAHSSTVYYDAARTVDVTVENSVNTAVRSFQRHSAASTSTSTSVYQSPRNNHPEKAQLEAPDTADTHASVIKSGR